MRTIKFSRCPVGKHQGEIWTKLLGRDLMHPAYLKRVECAWSDEIPMALIRDDTFNDFDKNDFDLLMHCYYGYSRVFVMILYFEHKDGDFTTIRGYKHSSYNFYEQSREESFKIILD